MLQLNYSPTPRPNPVFSTKISVSIYRISPRVRVKMLCCKESCKEEWRQECYWSLFLLIWRLKRLFQKNFVLVILISVSVRTAILEGLLQRRIEDPTCLNLLCQLWLQPQNVPASLKLTTRKHLN